MTNIDLSGSELALVCYILVHHLASLMRDNLALLLCILLISCEQRDAESTVAE